jgi:HK97 family phage major capsid protein
MSDMLELKKAIDAIGTGWEEFKKTNDELLKAKADGKSVVRPRGEARRDRRRPRQDAGAQGAFEGALTKLNRPDFGSDKLAETLGKRPSSSASRARATARRPATCPRRVHAYKTAFFSWMRKGHIDMLPEAERKAMFTGDDANGGYFLPTSTVGRVVKKVYELSPIRQIATVQPISTAALEGMYDNDEGTAAYVGELAARSNTNTPVVGKYRIEPFEIYANPKASQTLLDDAAVDVEAWLAGKIANKFARFEASEFINGTGAPGKISGFAGAYTLTATADGSRTWGQIEKVKTGANGDFAASNPADKLFDLIMAFKQAYLQNAKWVTRREVIAKVRKFKEATTNAYMWQPGLQAGQPDSLLGYPIVIAQDIPTLATASASMWFGDWAEAYTIVDRQGMRTIRDNLTDKPNVQFYTTYRVGGAVLNFEAIKALTFEA